MMHQLDNDSLSCICYRVVDANGLLSLAATCLRFSYASLREWARRFPLHLRRPYPTLLHFIENAFVGIVTNDSNFMSKVRVGIITPDLLPLVSVYRPSVDGGCSLLHALELPTEVCP